MKQIKGMQLGAVLAVMLLVIMAFVPAVSAQEQTASKIDKTEKEIIKKLDPNTKGSQEDLQKAEKIREEINSASRKAIESSLQNTTKDAQILAWDTVYRGTDRTFYTADAGNKGSSTWGVAPWWYGSDYYLSSNKAEASSVVGPGGYGGVGAWSWVGKQFYVSGTGSQSANIRANGHIAGLTSALAGGSSNVNINLVLWDASTGTRYSTPIYSKSEGGLGWTEVNGDFNNGVGVTLQSGHYYIAYLELITDAAVYGVGEAGSDFGRFDGDYSGEGAWYYSITVDF